MKKCPYCAEQVQDEAVKCKHCGSVLGDTRQTDGGSATDMGDTLDYGRTVAVDPASVGKVLAGRYRITDRLGSGGMGEVWLAEDSELRIQVALKLLPAILTRNQRSVEDLRREAAIALKLSHPTICRLHNFHSDGDVKFLVMEYIDGRTLEDVLAACPDRKMPWGQLKPIAMQIAQALDFAHDLTPAVLHRDIKPANIMVAADGAAKLLDFGIAQQIRDSMTRVTGRQDTSGTLPYMSPEQFRGDRTDARSDVYSFCTVLYEAITGLPFVASGGSIAWQIQEKQFQPLHDVPDEVNRILASGLAKAPAERPTRLSDCFASVPADIPAAQPVRVASPVPPVVPAQPVAPASVTASAATPDSMKATGWHDITHTKRRYSRLMCTLFGLLLPVVSLPVTLGLFAKYLQRHIVGRLKGAWTQNPRFADDNGQRVLAKLQSAQGFKPVLTIAACTVAGVAVAIMFLAVAVATVPADATYDWSSSLESILAGEYARAYYFYPSKSTYEKLEAAGCQASVFWTSDGNWSPTRDDELYKVPERKIASYSSGDTVYRSNGLPPYTDVAFHREGHSYGKGGGEWSRGTIMSVSLTYDCEVRTAVFYVLLALPFVVVGNVLHLLFWIRFFRHSKAELLAAAYATDDLALVERHMPAIRKQRRLALWLAIGCGITQLHLILFPFIAPVALRKHLAWEQNVGINAALGVPMEEVG